MLRERFSPKGRALAVPGRSAVSWLVCAGCLRPASAPSSNPGDANAGGGDDGGGGGPGCPRSFEVGFGTVPLGEPESGIFVIRNDEDAVIRLSNATWAGAAPSSFVLLSAPHEIAPGEVGGLRFSFAPTALGISAARLELDVENS